ncbi:hypothetical protein EE612_000405 [Oryza sativa]|nr:hypothetical protein EE612_000405 [Oryza sativa]
MALNPLFTVTFNVSGSGSDNYGDFIAGIRKRVANPRHFSHNRPVLPPVEPDVPPRRWFHVVLRTQTSELTLATRADNLYLEGFRRGSDGTSAWWELTRGLIAGATYLGFGGSYRELLGHTDNMVGVTLGPQQMTQAVDTLAGLAASGGGAARQRAGEALATLLLMVNEALRFLTVAELVGGFMNPRAVRKSGTITADVKEQVNGWKVLSRALLTMDALQLEDSNSASKHNKVDTKKMEQEKKAWEAAEKLAVEAAKAVGILLFVEKVPAGMTKATALQLFHGN